MPVTVTTPTTIIVQDSAARGPIGNTPNISVGTVTTGAPGSSVAVSTSGNSANVLLNFTIPRGNVGETGPANPDAYNQANSARDQANTGYGQANAAYAQANAAYNAANNAGGAGLPLANGTSNIDISTANGYVTVTANTFTWTFSETNGLLELAGNLANFSACSAINFVANSSGDGYGYSTIELRPDSNAVNDQYLIIDPTVVNHIHIRAGGAQDNSQGQLFIGGEYSNFSVGSGLNPPVFVTANQKTWTFETTGTFANPVMQYSDLPSPSTVGVRAFISDANVAATGNFGAIVSGGGSNNVPVFSDGTNWLVG